MDSTTSIELLKLKVFLYKYTPPFTQKIEESNTDNKLGKIDKYTVELDEKYFSKYDITNYVVTYSFDQTIDGNTYNWTLNLQEKLLTLTELKSIVIEGNAVDPATLGTYESQATNLADQPIIKAAKVERGINQQGEYTVKEGTNLPKIPQGLRLSDLIQSYDFISCFLYKDTTPLEEIHGTKKKINTIFVADMLPKQLDYFECNLIGQTLSSHDLQQETILLSRKNVSFGLPLFSNEFNGFVLTKTVSRQIGNVDTITLSGNGLTRLFGSTRRILKSSLMQDSIYDIGELIEPEAISPFQNIYVGKTLEEIFVDLFTIFYRIKFPSFIKNVPTEVNTSSNTITTSTGQEISLNMSITPGGTTLVSLPQRFFTGKNFYDLSTFYVGNAIQTNLYTIPPYLLSLVMKRRGFSYREPNGNISRHYLEDIASAPGVSIYDQNALATFLDSSSQYQTQPDGFYPIHISKELQPLKPYFKIIEDVLRYFNPELRTPFEILDEIKSKTFLEFIERPDGVVVIRPPQYNDTVNVVWSSDLDIINTAYIETANQLISRHKVGYGHDVIVQLNAVPEYSYANGKLLIQYGFMEAGADINPNVKDDKPIDAMLTKSKENGLFKYAEFFLRLHNANLKTGSVTCNLLPNVFVGQTFFDEKNNKFGYITSISKTVSVSGTATMTFQLSYVRDAYLTGETIHVEKLLRLVDLAQGFSQTQVDTSISDPFPQIVSFPR